MHPEVLLVVVGLGLGLPAAARALGEPLAPARGAALAAGLLGLLAALAGPVHALSEAGVFAAHMVQHLLLTLVVAPCLLAGTPPVVLDAVLARLAARPVLGRTVARVTRPLAALGLHALALACWHLPRPYAAAVASAGWHALQHATLAATAVLAWWPVVSPSRRLPALPHAARLLYLFVFGMPMTVVAALITGAEHVLYALEPTAPRPWGMSALEDQRLGGVLMWVPSGLVPLLAFTVVFFRWAAAEAEDDPAPAGPRG